MYTISHLNPVSMARSTIHPFRGVLGYAESLALIPFVAVLIPTLAFVQLCQDAGVASHSQKIIDKNRLTSPDASTSHERLRSQTDDSHLLMSISEAEQPTEITDRFDGSLHLIINDVYDSVYDSGTSQSEVISSFGSSSPMMEMKESTSGPDTSFETKDSYETYSEIEHAPVKFQTEDTNTDAPFGDSADPDNVYSIESIDRTQEAATDYESFRVGHSIETVVRLGVDVENSVEEDVERASSEELHTAAQGKQSKKNRKKRLRAKEKAKETKKPDAEKV